MKESFISLRNWIEAFVYKHVNKPLYFRSDPELVHSKLTESGERLGNHYSTKLLTRLLFCYKNKQLNQNVQGITFKNPIGLAAGFDYEARLTQILPDLGFGFHTVGTITCLPYEGNPTPRLGRLPNSKSLLVNKGFKSHGAKAGIEKLEELSFEIPLGVSIGRTNGNPQVATQEQAVADVVASFKLSENSNVKNSYYELNISCPNLTGNVTFYPPTHLNQLLDALSKLNIKKPVFIKMPINESKKDTLKMLEVADRYEFIKGIIFGNLQKNRLDPSFDQEEIKKAGKGNFSGKPTWKLSNELIAFSYKHYGKRFAIIGCGGIFTAEDAYTKIKLGASLVQLISGMIFQGPQTISSINQGLVKLLEKDGYKNISEAVGVDNKHSG